MAGSRLANAATYPYPPIYTLPRSTFSHLPPQDTVYLDYFIRKFRGQLSLSRLGDSALSDFCKYRHRLALTTPLQVQGPHAHASMDGPGSTTILQQGEQDSYVLDALLAVGALAWARRSMQLKGVPLVQHQLSGALKNEHYRKALQHYNRAVARTQQALKDAAAETQVRVMVISCMLFFMFEHLQDNTSAVDQIGAVGLDILPRLVSAATPVALRSSTEAAHFVLSSNVIQNAFSPLHQQMRPRILNIAAESVLQPPAVPSPARSLQEFTAVWWRFVTTMLNLCFHSAAFGDGFIVPSYSPSQISSLLTLISSWEREARRRAGAALDLHSIRLLQVIANMANRLMRSVKKRKPAPKGSPESDGGAQTFFSAAPLDHSALLELYKISKRHQDDDAGGPRPPAAGEDQFDFMHDAGQDAALPALLYVARWCPDRATRLEALDICRSLLRSASSFNLKAIYMVMRALVNMEGDGEEPAARYTWTEGSWNHDYTALQVTLTPADQEHTPNTPGTKYLVLSVREYGF